MVTVLDLARPLQKWRTVAARRRTRIRRQTTRRAVRTPAIHLYWFNCCEVEVVAGDAEMKVLEMGWREALVPKLEVRVVWTEGVEVVGKQSCL